MNPCDYIEWRVLIEAGLIGFVVGALLGLTVGSYVLNRARHNGRTAPDKEE